MHSFLRLNSFKIYNILLIIVFSIIVNDNHSFPLIYTAFYCIFHFLIIYLGVYYYRKQLYFIYFLYGLGLDIFWLNEIGPHLIVFMSMLVFFNLSTKYFYNLSSFKIYVVLIIIQLTMISFEVFVSFFLLNFSFNLNYFIQIYLSTLLLSFPIFLFFSKIDKYK